MKRTAFLVSHRLRTSLWLIPFACALAGIVLAFVTRWNSSPVFGGIAVHIGARVASLADPDQDRAGKRRPGLGKSSPKLATGRDVCAAALTRFESNADRGLRGRP